MSKASHGAPPERTDQDQTVDEDTPVQIERPESDDELGIVRQVIDGPQRRVVVETRDGEVNTAAERVDVVTGIHADLIRDKIGDTEGSDDV